LPHIQGRDEFVVAERDSYTVINYVVSMADTFEMDMNNISLTDATIQGVLSQEKLPAQGDFYKQLRQDARYRNTTTAQREASSFATGLASAMGF
jgi:hypothetical protein